MSTMTIHDISQAIHDEVVDELTELAERYNLKIKINVRTATIELPEVEG